MNFRIWQFQKRLNKGYRLIASFVLIILLFIGLTSFPLLAQPKTEQPKVPLSPQPKGQTLRVATGIISPFVLKDGKFLSGFSIELWQEIANELGLKYQFKEYIGTSKLLDAVSQNQADLGISTITITAEREKKFDFSYPIFHNGLQIMVRSSQNSTSSANPIDSVLSFGRNLFTTIIPKLLNFGSIFLGLGILLSIIVAHLVWFFERGNPEPLFATEKYIPGIFEAFWWALTNLFGQQEHPKKLLSRIVSFFWVFTAVLMLAYFTASLTSDLTVQQINGDIKGLDDLKDKIVGTTRNSAPSIFLKEHDIKTIESESIDQVFENLLLKKVDAVVFDSPILHYYSTHEGQGKVQIVGEIFNESEYGIVFPQNSPIKKQIDVALLKLHDNGTYTRLYHKYFKQDN